MKNYVNSGDIIAVTAAADVEAGDFVKVGELNGFAQNGATAGDVIGLQLVGRFATDVTTVADVAVGDAVYFDGATLNTDDGAGDNEKIGVAVTAGVEVSGTAEVDVRLG